MSNNKYVVVVEANGEAARLNCATLEEAQQVRQSFVNYGCYDKVTIEPVAGANQTEL